jgi:hypothetical protein
MLIKKLQGKNGKYNNHNGINHNGDFDVRQEKVNVREQKTGKKYN